MHELSVTQSILEIALRHGRQAGAHRITDLYLVIGELSSIIDDSVQFYWDFISKDSPAEGARLHFRRIPAELGCLECDARYGTDEDLACPECGSTHVQVVTGDEFYLESMQVSEVPAQNLREEESV